MQTIAISCPPPLIRDVNEFKEREGYENQSQAARELLRRSLYEAETQGCKQ